MALAIIERAEEAVAVVADECDRRLLGVITHRSILEHLRAGEPLDPRSTPCKDAMVAEELTCATPYHDEETVWVMSERLGHPVPRVDREGRFLHFASGQRPDWYSRYESRFESRF
jgi:CBS-domain-containing membrane protein